MHERHVEKYADILFEILHRKDSDTNYYFKLHTMAKEQHGDKSGVVLASYEAGVQVRRALREFAGQCLKDGTDIAGFTPSEIFERVEPILVERLKLIN